MQNKEKHIPKRRCIGCMESKPQAELIRIAYGTGCAIDTSGAGLGRGMYICRSEDCLNKAVKRNSFQRASKGSVSGNAVDDVVKELYEIIKSDDAR